IPSFWANAASAAVPHQPRDGPQRPGTPGASRDRARVRGPETVAAVLMEAMIGGSGMIVCQDGYLRGVREICDRHGIALIFEEVMTDSAGPAPGSPASTGTCCRT